MSLLSRAPLLGQQRQREMLKSATSLAYAETDQGPLHAHFFGPPDFNGDRVYPVVVFLHGGFWDTPMVTQFVPHCLHFASRGAVTVALETRVEATHGSGPLDALEDLRSFLRWHERQASLFHTDPQRLVLGGASGGAWLALQTVLPKPSKNELIGEFPPAAGLMLFSALLDTGTLSDRFPDPRAARRMNPLRQLRRGLPPMLLCHGKSDRVTPFDAAQRFTRAARWRRSRIELLDFEQADHSFFNFNVSELHYELTLKAADRFLVGLGMLPADPFPDP